MSPKFSTCYHYQSTNPYLSKTYREEHENPDKALLANLGILSAVWNKLIEMNLSPRYLSKAYDDIYVIVLAYVDKETDEYMEVDRLRIHVSKHPLDAKILDLSQRTPEIPNRIIAEMSRMKMDFHHPMFKFQELKSKLKSQEKESEKPEGKTTSRGECAKYSLDYIKQLIQDDPYIFDPRFQKIWDNSEFFQAYENDDWHTNSGHFNYVVPCWKKNGGSKEELYDNTSEQRQASSYTIEVLGEGFR